MSNPEKDEEILARKWLESQGYTDIKRPCSDPPDYVVNNEYAVEVRRLNQRIEIDGRFKGEEQSRIALRDTIEKVLEEFGPPNEGQVWIVDCEYDFSKPLPEKRITKREIGKALQPLSRPCGDDVIEQLRSEYMDYDKHAHELKYLNHPHLCLPCGICLELEAINPLESTELNFLLQNVSGRESILVAHKLINSIQHYVIEKSLKVRKSKTNKIDDYKGWWLVLIDHICHVPIQVLGESELKALRESIRDRGCWSWVVIISAKNINWSYELLSPPGNGDSSPPSPLR